MCAVMLIVYFLKSSFFHPNILYAKLQLNMRIKIVGSQIFFPMHLFSKAIRGCITTTKKKRSGGGNQESGRHGVIG